MQGASREVTGNSQETKQIDRTVIVHSSCSSSSTSTVLGLTTPANLENDFQIFSRGTIEFIITGKGGATLLDTKFQSVQ